MRGKRLVSEEDQKFYAEKRAKKSQRLQQRVVSHRDAILPGHGQHDATADDKHYRPVRLENMVARTKAQGRYIAAIRTHSLVFGIGPAGTGKTHIAAGSAAAFLAEGAVDRIILSRPAVDAGRGLGFLPGDMNEKFAVWAAPFMIELTKYLGHSHVELLKKRERIVISPLEYMQGLTFERSFVVLDEAENTTPREMKMFLTRIGEGTKAVVDGDLAQALVGSDNGLCDALNRLHDCPDTTIVEFTRKDIVRSGLVKDVLERYET